MAAISIASYEYHPDELNQHEHTRQLIYSMSRKFGKQEGTSSDLCALVVSGNLLLPDGNTIPNNLLKTYEAEKPLYNILSQHGWQTYHKQCVELFDIGSMFHSNDTEINRLADEVDALIAQARQGSISLPEISYTNGDSNYHYLSNTDAPQKQFEENKVLTGKQTPDYGNE